MTDETKTLHDWLTKIYATHGRLTPAIVKEAARPEDSPAHMYIYNVPADEAAERYYLDRARDLIQSVRIRVVSQPSQPPRFVRAYVSLLDDQGTRYEPLPRVLKDPELYAQARDAALRRIRAAESSLEALEFAAATYAPEKRSRTHRARTLVHEAQEQLEDQPTPV